jgi:hypothetical protein
VMGKSEVMEEKETAIGKMCIAVRGYPLRWPNVIMGHELFWLPSNCWH